YQIDAEIGKGSFANVYKAININSNKPVAIKAVLRSKLKNKKLLENLEIEIQILKEMKHPHIVSLLDCKQSLNYFHLIMEYCSLGDLSFFIKKKNQLISSNPIIHQIFNKYPSPSLISSNNNDNNNVPSSLNNSLYANGLNHLMILHFLKQLSSSLKFLRSKNLVHRDIKPQNLLLCYPLHDKASFQNLNYVGIWDLPILKIADFGFARFLPNTSMAETLCGSPLYMAPEILNYEKYNAKADLWSVGAVLYEMTVGKPPFRANNHIELLRKIQKQNDKIIFPHDFHINTNLKILISSLLRLNPTERISFHEFFNDELVNYDLSPYNTTQSSSLNNSNISSNNSTIDENLFISEFITSPQIKAQNQNKNQNQIQNQIQNQTQNQTQTQTQTQNQNQIRTQNQINFINNSPPKQKQKSSSIQKQTSTSPPQILEIPSNRQNVPTASDIIEKDYVVVEKRSVEVNALADELADIGTGAVAINNTNNTNNLNILNNNINLNNILNLTNNSSFSNQRKSSFENRRISLSFSPTNPLSKALGIATTRLFPTFKTINPTSNNNSPPQNNDYNNHRFSPSSSPNYGNMNTISNTDYAISYDEEAEIIIQLEPLAAKSHAIKTYADTKYSQIVPAPPSSAIDDSDSDEDDQENNVLPPISIKSLAEEGYVLYYKCLSLLAKAMRITGEWWNNNRNNGTQRPASVRLNNLVQGCRNEFNDCLDKARFLSIKINDVVKKLNLTQQKLDVFAEKLIFDRALEISRTAAVNEMVGENLVSCEIDYTTALWMLEALIDDDNSTQNYNNSLEVGDRQLVEKFIVTIGNRVTILRSRID
ncbi:serine/threonine protein kinase ATG1, partial [Ascoidea rubescens DSM 1968]